jgi:hypothetical protein
MIEAFAKRRAVILPPFTSGRHWLAHRNFNGILAAKAVESSAPRVFAPIIVAIQRVFSLCCRFSTNANGPVAAPVVERATSAAANKIAD